MKGNLLISIACFFQLWIITRSSSAQTLGELMLTKQYSSVETWGNYNFKENAKWSLFNYTRFRVNHESSLGNEFFSYPTINYEFLKGLSISGGGFISNSGFSPIVALNYFFNNELWLINFFPGLELKQQKNADLFFFLQFRPKVYKEHRLFTQIVANSNFNFLRHNFSEQSVRIGWDFKSFQIGAGYDFRQLRKPTGEIGEEHIFQKNAGIFIRKEF